MAFSAHAVPMGAAKFAGEIFLITGGKDRSGREAWYYVQIPPMKVALFKKAAASGKLRLTDHGAIVESGFGAEPTVAASERMRREFGFKG